MTKPKYNIGDKFWIISGGKINEATITCVMLSRDGVIKYLFDYGIDFILEDGIFPTKEALIKSL